MPIGHKNITGQFLDMKMPLIREGIGIQFDETVICNAELS